MALRVTPRTLARPARGPAAPERTLTLEEARAAYPAGTLERVVAELTEAQRLDDASRELVNAKNRQDTQVNKAMRSYATATNMLPEDEVQFGKHGYRYDVTHAEKVSVEGLLEMYENKQVTKDELIRSITVNKAAAEKAIGPHKLLQITRPEDGKKLDIRKRDLDQPVETATVVRTTGKVEPKLNLAQQEAPPQRTATTKSVLKPKRSLKLRK